MNNLFQSPKLLPIIQYYLNNNCDMEQQLENRLSASSDGNMHLDHRPNLPLMLRKSMHLFIIELIPQILVSDGHNFIETTFTKESINDFRKNYSHMKFSSLRDKVIYIQKWSLQIESVDSRQVFNSYQNFTIKLVVEQFKPLMSEQLNQRLTHSALSLFRNDKIMTLLKNYRHWFAQTLINQNMVNANMAYGEESKIFEMPSLSMVTKKVKTEQVGKAIQETQVFRVSDDSVDFDKHTSLSVDIDEDMPQFLTEVLKKKEQQTKDLRIAECDRIVLQEKGESYFNDKLKMKKRQWNDQVEDEFRREKLALQLDYFNIKQDKNEEMKFESNEQRDERDKARKRQRCQSSKRIIGYTFTNSTETIKSKLVRMLTHRENKDAAARPRANSDEKILIAREDEAKTNVKQGLSVMQRNDNYGNNALSQFQPPSMPALLCDDGETESENSMDAELNKELDMEKRVKPKKITELEVETNKAQPMSVSLYRQYLEWFTQFELERVRPTEIVAQSEHVVKIGGKDSAPITQSDNTTKAESIVRRAFQDLHDQEDVQMSPESKTADENAVMEATESVQNSSDDNEKIIKPTQIQEGSQEEIEAKQIEDINMEISQEELCIKPQVQSETQNEVSEPIVETYESPIKQAQPAPVEEESSEEEDLSHLSPQKKAVRMAELEIEQMQKKIQKMIKERARLQQIEKEAEELKIKQEAERKEKERLEAERLERERIEAERQAKLEAERIERERIEAERLEAERLEQARIEAERQAAEEAARIEAERIAKEEAKRLAAEEAARQEEAARLENERLEKIRIQKEELKALKLKEKQERERLEFEKIKQNQLRLEQERRDRENTVAAEQTLKQKQEQLFQKRLELEMERKKAIARKQALEKAKQEAQAQEMLELKAEEPAAVAVEEVEMEKEKEKPQESDELDWGEGQPEEEGSKTESENDNEQDQDSEEVRGEYIDKMTEKFGGKLNNEIRQLEHQDLKRRQIKNQSNSDKLYDFVKIKEIKAQQKQKEAPLPLPEVDPESEAAEESYSEVEEDREDREIVEVYSDDDEEVQVINQTVPSQVPQTISSDSSQVQASVAPVAPVGTIPNDVLKHLEMLTQQVAMLTSKLNSQNAPQPATVVEPVLETQEEDYHVPVFGSQNAVQEPEEERQERQNLKRRFEQRVQKDENGQPFGSLKEFADFATMQQQKKEISKQHQDMHRRRAMRDQRSQSVERRGGSSQMTGDQRHLRRSRESHSQERGQVRRVDKNGQPLRQRPSGYSMQQQMGTRRIAPSQQQTESKDVLREAATGEEPTKRRRIE